MNVNPLHNPLTAADVPIDRLEGNRTLTEEQKIGEVSRQFEALLLRQILEQTQKTVFASEFTNDSATSAIYRDLIVDQLADSISKSGTFGLAQTVHHQLASQLHLTLPDGSHPGPAATPTAPAGLESVRPPLSSSINSPPAAASDRPAGIASAQNTNHE